MPKTFLVRAELSADAKKTVNSLSKHIGMTQFAMMSRLVAFFLSQENLVQIAMIVRFPPEIEADIAGMSLKKLD